jgi:hypothetical protein
MDRVPPVSYTTVTHLIVHHTAGRTAQPTGPLWFALSGISIFTIGYIDIGYNYLIDPNGVIYEEFPAVTTCRVPISVGSTVAP